MKKSTAAFGCGILSVSLLLTISYLLLNDEAKESLQSLIRFLRDKGNETVKAAKVRRDQEGSSTKNRERTLNEWKAIGF
jgi:hypothetical protein